MNKKLNKLIFSILTMSTISAFAAETVQPKCLWDVYGSYVKEKSAALAGALARGTWSAVKAPFSYAYKHPKYTAVATAVLYVAYVRSSELRLKAKLSEDIKWANHYINKYQRDKYLSTEDLQRMQPYVDRLASNSSLIQKFNNEINANINRKEDRWKVIAPKLEQWLNRYNQKLVWSGQGDSWYSKENLSNSLSNINTIACRITSKLYQPWETRAIEAWLGWWKIQQEYNRAAPTVPSAPIASGPSILGD